jgi:hypothetical protein
MELSTTREDNSCVGSYPRNSPHFWNPKVYYRIQKSLPLVPIMSQTNPVHTTQRYFSKIHLNIIKATGWTTEGLEHESR